MQYCVQDFKSSTFYELSPDVLAIIRQLEKKIIPNNFSTESLHSVQKIHKPLHVNVPWIKSPKPKKMEVKEITDIDEIRITLNKISTKNYESQKSHILGRMERILLMNDITILKTITQFILDVASGNKFYSDLYVELYSVLVDLSPIFKDVLEEHLNIFKNSVDNIHYIDPAIDYDGYCKYIKFNDNMRAIASFYILLVGKNIIEANIMLNIIAYFQTKLITFIDELDKNVQCDEISEILYILITIGNKIPSMTQSILWTTIYETTSKITKYSVKEHKSLSSRLLYKQMDIITLLDSKKEVQNDKNC